jgi:hypothetical protein
MLRARPANETPSSRLVIDGSYAKRGFIPTITVCVMGGSEATTHVEGPADGGGGSSDPFGGDAGRQIDAGRDPPAELGARAGIRPTPADHARPADAKRGRAIGTDRHGAADPRGRAEGAARFELARDAGVAGRCTYARGDLRVLTSQMLA